MINTHCTKENRSSNGKLRSRRGMTMAEMLITIAIILILAAVAFISLFAYQKTMAQKERDEVAREIFIAAQNHLTMSRGEGYLDAYHNNKLGETGNNGTRYFIVNDASDYTDVINNRRVIDYMLPFGSIDEKIRTGGSYMICYEPKRGKITDVFYCTKNDTPARFNYTIQDGSAEYTKLMDLKGDSNKDARTKLGTNGTGIVGWYGGEDLQNLGTNLNAPGVAVTNGEQLTVTITDTNGSVDGVGIKLLITGETSKARKAVNIKGGTADTSGRLDTTTLTYTIDDVYSSGKHFCQLLSDTNDKHFIAGEDLRIEAVAYCNTALANLGFSEPKVENSLYESIYTHPTNGTTTALISTVRHLENLEEDVSNTGYYTGGTNTNRQFFIDAAKQTKDLVRSTGTGSTQGTYVYGKTDTSSTIKYWPVSCEKPIDYDGLRHSITGIETSFIGDAGMFGTLTSTTDDQNNVAKCTISNLELINFDITSTGGNAGALAGTSNNAVIDNVVAYNDVSTRFTTGDAEAKRVSECTKKSVVASGSGKSAGGLIGAVSGGTVSHSAAALVVEGKANAGGLIGGASGAAISSCYSGGHTYNGKYHEKGYNPTTNNKPLYNVTSDGAAGGLVGNAGSSSISNSYSTCSASGSSNTGGFVGTASGSISNCYCTGLVSGDNAFIGSGGASVSSSKYYELVNEKAGSSGIEGKPAGTSGASALDAENSYDTFVGGYSVWNDAVPYDSGTVDNIINGVGKYYGGRYNLKTVTQLTQTTKARINNTDTYKTGNDINDGWYFVNVHHGDWPAPEMMFVNN